MPETLETRNTIQTTPCRVVRHRQSLANDAKHFAKKARLYVTRIHKLPNAMKKIVKPVPYAWTTFVKNNQQR